MRTLPSTSAPVSPAPTAATAALAADWARSYAATVARGAERCGLTNRHCSRVQSVSVQTETGTGTTELLTVAAPPGFVPGLVTVESEGRISSNVSPVSKSIFVLRSNWDC